jgi:hypothetical protein
MALAKCIGCGGLFLECQGPTHRYMESSPGCWAAYGEVLAREYSDPAYAEVHRLGVDAYAVQHPGNPSPQTIQSVARHLIRLCLLLEHELAMDRANDAMLAATKSKFVWLTPPSNRGEITVADVHRATTAEDHTALVRTWAESAWTAWKPHHGQIQAWLPSQFVQR